MKFSVILHDNSDSEGMWFDAQSITILDKRGSNIYDQALLAAATEAKSNEETEDGLESWQNVSIDMIIEWINDKCYDYVPSSCRCYGHGQISIFVHMVGA